MNTFLTIIWAEWLKIRRSRMLLISILMYIFIPCMLGLMMFISKNPDLAEKFGIIGTKATVLNLTTNWPTYFSFLNMGIAAFGIIGFGFITSWIFGHEFADRTIKDIISLPFPRISIPLSKFTVLAILNIFFSTLFLLFGISFGYLVGLDGWSMDSIVSNIFRFYNTTWLTFLLCTSVAFFAGLGRGYWVPIVFITLMMILSQFMGVLGFAIYFPWGIPMLYATPSETQFEFVSYFLLALTGILGFIGTLTWWRNADQT